MFKAKVALEAIRAKRRSLLNCRRNSASMRPKATRGIVQLSDPASNGNTNRMRLNRGGNRQTNAALYRVAIVRMAWDFAVYPRR